MLPVAICSAARRVGGGSGEASLPLHAPHRCLRLHAIACELVLLERVSEQPFSLWLNAATEGGRCFWGKHTALCSSACFALCTQGTPHRKLRQQCSSAPAVSACALVCSACAGVCVGSAGECEHVQSSSSDVSTLTHSQARLYRLWMDGTDSTAYRIAC